MMRRSSRSPVQGRPGAKCPNGPPAPPLLPLTSPPPPAARRSRSSPSLPQSSIGSSSSVGSGSSTGSISPPLSPRRIECDRDAALPVVMANHHPQYLQKSSAASSRTSHTFILQTFGLFILAIGGVGLYGKYSSVLRTVDELAVERDELAALRDADLAACHRLESELDREAMSRADADAEVKRLRKEKEEKAQAIEKNRRAAEELREEIQRQSRREVLDKFGPGPHRVEMKIEIPKPGTADEHTLHFLDLEMASLDLMPHSVNTFLNQVSKKLWNGAEIFRNREHILMTRLEHPSNTGPSRFSQFHDAGLSRLSFPEYSPDYPHEKYTLGFAGRPGGPHFYFNKIDNTFNHGPNPEEDDGGDPCFATVVERKELIDRIAGLSTRKEDAVLDRPVVIREAYVLVQGEDGKFVHHSSS